MIAVGGIVVGPKHSIEHAASAVVNLVQEFPGRVAAVPFVYHTDASAIREYEPCHIECIGCRVPAQRRVLEPVDIAAGVSADVLEPSHPLAKVSKRGRHQNVMLPQCKADGASAGQRERLTHANARRLDAHGA